MSYNKNNLRILWELSGLDGLRYNNIIYSSGSYYGDYDVLNIKNDIVEKKYRTTVREMEIVIDVGSVDPIYAPIQRTQAIYIDTFSLLNTNLTLDATIELRGYGSPSAGTPSLIFMRESSERIFKKTKRELCGNDPYQKDVIWLSDTEPEKRYRYIYMLIKDVNNLDGYIEVGRILGGEATILINNKNGDFGSDSYKEDIEYEEVSYTDKVQLNGFTEIANERAFKKKINLTFENMNTLSQNYKNLKKYWRYCRDTKKALIIPTPSNPCGFHVFSKLEKVPSQRIRYVEDSQILVDFQLSYDEAR